MVTFNRDLNMLALILLFMSIIPTTLTSNHAALHLPLYRREGRFTHHELANLTQLHDTLLKIEHRYSRSHRVIENNGLVRRWNSQHEDGAMLDEAGLTGQWYDTRTTSFSSQHAKLTIWVTTGSPKSRLATLLRR